MKIRRVSLTSSNRLLNTWRDGGAVKGSLGDGEELTRISLMTSVPDEEWQWFRWRAEGASLASRSFPEPQSWSALLHHAEGRHTDNLPTLLRQEPEFLSYFVLVFPHRWNVHTMKGLEVAFGAW